MPAEAKGTSEKSAKAFVRHYVSLVNFALRTGDAQALKAASSARCKSCRAVAANIEDVYGDGGSLTGKGWRVTVIEPVAEQPRSEPVLQTGVFVSPQDKVAKPGADVERFDGGQNLMTFFLKRHSNAWIVSKWDQTR
ncbi:MAG TPA: DUF6318 family protein [Nocardioidaceae bacterium]|nr:DUF6318 family protein [Nocardioidaceae bacterium]